MVLPSTTASSQPASSFSMPCVRGQPSRRASGLQAAPRPALPFGRRAHCTAYPACTHTRAARQGQWHAPRVRIAASPRQQPWPPRLQDETGGGAGAVGGCDAHDAQQRRDVLVRLCGHAIRHKRACIEHGMAAARWVRISGVIAARLVPCLAGRRQPHGSSATAQRNATTSSAVDEARRTRLLVDGRDDHLNGCMNRWWAGSDGGQSSGRVCGR